LIKKDGLNGQNYWFNSWWKWLQMNRKFIASSLQMNKRCLQPLRSQIIHDLLGTKSSYTGVIFWCRLIFLSFFLSFFLTKITSTKFGNSVTLLLLFSTRWAISPNKPNVFWSFKKTIFLVLASSSNKSRGSCMWITSPIAGLCFISRSTHSEERAKAFVLVPWKVAYLAI